MPRAGPPLCTATTTATAIATTPSRSRRSRNRSTTATATTRSASTLPLTPRQPSPRHVSRRPAIATITATTAYITMDGARRHRPRQQLTAGGSLGFPVTFGADDEPKDI